MVSVRFALGGYATDEDAETMSVNLIAIGLAELNCSGPVEVTVGLANKDFDFRHITRYVSPLGSRSTWYGEVHSYRLQEEETSFWI